MNYRSDIDGLRAVSIFAVLMFHFFPALAKGGFIGVDVFFVISGYLITNIILSELKAGKFSFVSFFIRRVKRIFPALILVLISVLIAGYFLLFDNEFKLLAKHIVANFFFSMNFALYTESGYFDVASDVKPLLHLWSLAVEEQFYLFYPVILLVATRKNIKITSLLLSIIVISFSLNMYFLKYHNMSFYMPFTRAWELLMGGVLVYISNYINSSKFEKTEHKLNNICKKILFFKCTNKENIFRNVLSFLGLITIIYISIFFSKISKFPGKYALFPVIGAMFIILAGPQSWINRKILSSRGFVLGGKISYPLYLWHWPVLSFAIITSSGNITNAVMILLLLISIVFALATYFLLEKPIKKLRVNKVIAATCLMFSLVIGTLGWYIFAQDGMRDRKINNMFIKREIMTFNHDLYKDLIDCSELSLPSGIKNNSLLEFCYSKTKLPEFAILGDSHVIPFAYGAINNDMNVLFWSAASILPFRHYIDYNNGCNPKSMQIRSAQNMLNMIDALIKLDSIKYIVLNSRGPMHLEGSGFGIELDGMGDWILEEKDSNKIVNNKYDVFIEEYSSIIQLIHNAGKKVVFAIDIPELGIDPNSCISRPASFNHSPNIGKCFVSREVHEKRNYNYYKMVAELKSKFPFLIVFDPRDAFCDKDKCYGILNNKLLYSDDDHLNVVGADILGKKLKEFLDKQRVFD